LAIIAVFAFVFSAIAGSFDKTAITGTILSGRIQSMKNLKHRLCQLRALKLEVDFKRGINVNVPSIFMN